MDHFLRPGLRFEVVDSGPPDAPAVVLLHGFRRPTSGDATMLFWLGLLSN